MGLCIDASDSVGCLTFTEQCETPDEILDITRMDVSRAELGDDYRRACGAVVNRTSVLASRLTGRDVSARTCL